MRNIFLIPTEQESWICLKDGKLDENLKRVAIINSLSNLLSASKIMLKRGKIEKAEEINKLVKNYIDRISNSEQGI